MEREREISSLFDLNWNFSLSLFTLPMAPKRPGFCFLQHQSSVSYSETDSPGETHFFASKLGKMEKPVSSKTHQQRPSFFFTFVFFLNNLSATLENHHGPANSSFWDNFVRLKERPCDEQNIFLQFDKNLLSYGNRTLLLQSGLMGPIRDQSKSFTIDFFFSTRVCIYETLMGP